MPGIFNGVLTRKWFWIFLPVLVAGGIGIFYLRKSPPGKEKGPPDRSSMPVSIVAVRAKKSSIGVYLTGLGTVTPLKTVTVRSRVDGQLVSIRFRESQLVREGELIAIIDPRPFEAQVAQAEGQLARDQALLANAKVDLERYRTLYSQDSIPKQQLDTQVALVRQYEAAIKADGGVVDNARLQLRYSRIQAPISGKTGLRLVDQGNIIRATDPTGIVVITQLQPITVVFTLPEDALPVVRKQMHAKKPIGVEAFDRSQKNHLATGSLTAMDNQVDTATGTVKLKATFPNRDEGLFPNQFVNIRMLVDTRRDVTSLPVSAVQHGAQGMFVYVVKDDNTVALRSVQTGTDDGERVEILSGVSVEEKVVVDGADKLREGSKVEAVMREEPEKPASPASAQKPVSPAAGQKPGPAMQKNRPPKRERNR